MLQEFFKSNLSKAVHIQDGFEHDLEMISMISKNDIDHSIVLKWMRAYGLFQGITTNDRNLIASAFINSVEKIKTKASGNKKLNIELTFSELFNILYQVKPRQWISATSKLLWCTFPADIVIYDSFVEKVVSVLQCLNPELAKFKRIGNCPKGKDKNFSIQLISAFYMNYQSMVKKIYHDNAQLIKIFKRENNIKYPYDLRIIDKLLWLMGKSNEPFTLDGIKCVN